MPTCSVGQSHRRKVLGREAGVAAATPTDMSIQRGLGFAL
jgi:hypothetical protein